VPRLITIGGQVYEVVAETPAGSLFLLNRSGLARQRIEDLQHLLADATAALARAEQDGVSHDEQPASPPAIVTES
jgi:hypothetical protein